MPYDRAVILFSLLVVWKVLCLAAELYLLPSSYTCLHVLPKDPTMFLVLRNLSICPEPSLKPVHILGPPNIIYVFMTCEKIVLFDEQEKASFNYYPQNHVHFFRTSPNCFSSNFPTFIHGRKSDHDMRWYWFNQHGCILKG